MNNHERVSNLVDEYVSQNGTETEMTRGEFLEWVNKTFPSISAAKNNLYPTDISYNLYNAGLKDFPGPNLCLVYDLNTEKFRLVGTGYKHTGNIYQYLGKSNQRIVGRWRDGVCEMMDRYIDATGVSENILLRRDDLADCLAAELQSIPVEIMKSGSVVEINYQEFLICGINVEKETYKLFNASSEWAEKTTYLCEEGDNDTWFYYLDTIDECIGECRRLVMFEAQNGKKTKTIKPRSSELGQYLTPERFEKIFKSFMEQADKNAISKKSEGTKMPYGMSSNEFDGANFCQQFGHGAASLSPHLNWWVVSIYYIVSSGRIVMGIEEDRYPHLGKMTKPINFTKLGNRNMDIAVYYEADKNTVDYKNLCDSFVSVCEEVIKLGLVDKNTY